RATVCLLRLCRVPALYPCPPCWCFSLFSLESHSRADSDRSQERLISERLRIVAIRKVFNRQQRRQLSRDRHRHPCVPQGVSRVLAEGRAEQAKVAVDELTDEDPADIAGDALPRDRCANGSGLARPPEQLVAETEHRVAGNGAFNNL